MSDQKILSLEELAQRAEECRRNGRKLVLCHGTFDLMHPGHIRHLQRARSHGDVLFVTLTADAHVNKGPGRPVFTQALRAETLAALDCVDAVAINHAPTGVNVIGLLRPAIYVKGSDYRDAAADVTGGIALEREAVEQYGGELRFTDEIVFSSSSLLNQHFDVFPPETRRYLADFRARLAGDDPVGRLKAARNLRIAVVGDAIVDEYHYVSHLGQAGKGNMLAVRYESEERFAGGAIAVANHLAGFVGEVTLVTALGALNSQEDFIRSRLPAAVKPVFFSLPETPTVTKRRFVDGDLNKLFEVYFYDDRPLAPAVEAKVIAWLAAELAGYDLVVVPDFGNGFVSPAIVAALSRHARLLAVNTQINSGNRGYHVIHRYPRSDFVSLNEPELRLAAHDRHSPLEDVAREVAARIGCRWLAVTRGTRGALLLDVAGDRFHPVPALSNRVVDRIGAGDAFLAFSALMLGAGASPEHAVFVGSAAAAIDVQIVCNREPVSPAALFKYVGTLLK